MGGLFLGLFFGPTFLSNLGQTWEGAFGDDGYHFPPLELCPLVHSLKGTLYKNLQVLRHFPEPVTCRGKADQKALKDIIGNSGLDLLGFARACLGLLGQGWACLSFLEPAWVCLNMRYVVWTSH